MANIRWVGGASIIPGQWQSVVGGTPAAGQVYTFQIGLRLYSYTALNTDTNATIAAAVEALLAASTWGEFLENTFSVNSATITTVGPASGAPVTITTSATGTGTFVTTQTVTPSSPNDVSIATNYSGGVLPTTGDNLSADHTNTDMLWNLQHFTGVVFASLSLPASFEAGPTGNGTCGLPTVNSRGSASYVEYRQRAFQCAPTTCTIGNNDGGGSASGFIYLDFGTATVSLAVHNTGSSTQTDLEALLVKGGRDRRAHV